MSVKYFYILILAVICVAHAQSDDADQNGDRVLRAQIRKLNAKQSRGKAIGDHTFMLAGVAYERFAPDNYTGSEDYETLKTFVLDVSNRTKEHFADVERQARATGVFKYTSPTLYVMGLVDAGRENLVGPVRRAILGSDEFDDATKTQCADLWTDAADIYMERFRKLSKIQETNPEEFFIIEDANGWDDIHTPMPADSSPEVLNVSEQIKATMDELLVQNEQLTARFKRLNIKPRRRAATE